MTNSQRLAIIRGVHTAIFAVMAVSTFTLLYARTTGHHAAWLWVALAVLAIKVVVFAGSGTRSS